jgi:hypothetical protein
MVHGIGDYGKHGTLPWRASPQFISYGYMKPFLSPGDRGAKIFFGIVDIKCVKIDNLRSIRLGYPQELSFSNEKAFAWEQETFRPFA